MTLTGRSLIAGIATTGDGSRFAAIDPATGEELRPEFTELTVDQLAAATASAADAALAYARTSPTERAAFLEAIAEEIEALGPELIERAHLESGLPAARIEGERGRTCTQLRLFAAVVRQGDHLGVRIDPAQPERTPLPRADLRLRMVPLGPVAVFGASNFPLAFSVAGGDTASALAAGCPVIVKAHHAHPGTAELVGLAVVAAARRTGMPAGVFSLVFGPGRSVGTALVTDPAIQAVGFTGSRTGGLALVAAAAGRPQPIPVYAEMSSVNPVVVLPHAVPDSAPDAEADRTALAAAYVGSLTLGSGQFCTNPGLLFLPTGPAGDALVAAIGETVAQATGQTMLTPDICATYRDGTARMSERAATVAAGRVGTGANAPAPQVWQTDAAALAADPGLTDEVFGAAGVVVRYPDLASLREALAALAGQLTATVHAAEADYADAAELLPILESRAGRVIFNGWPTGVEVSHAMVHGGPFPATSDARSTSVGTLAIERWQRPVCYQDVPTALLPPALHPDNPWGLTRRVDGTLTR